MKYALVTLEMEIADDLADTIRINELARHNLVTATKFAGEVVAVIIADQPSAQATESSRLTW